MKRKILFLVFTDSACIQNHAFMYAIDLHKAGHETKLILEGKGTLALRRLAKGDERFIGFYKAACEKDILVGACRKASGGCVDEKDSVQDIANQYSIELLDDLMGHAGITKYVDEGYEVITF